MALVVVYDKGAVSPFDIVGKVSLPLIVVLADTAHARRMRPLFAESCLAVYDLADDDLVAAVGRHRPAGIQTYSEPMLRATSALAAALGLAFHDADVVTLLTRKDAQRQRLRDAGVDPTVSVTLTDLGEWDSAVARIGLPVVVKPASGVSSRNTLLISDADAGRELVGPIIDQEGTVVVEEYLSGVSIPAPWGDYVSVETVVRDGEPHHLAVTGKLRLAVPFRETGQFWPCRLDTPTHAEVLTLADQAVKALNVVSGILHIEIKLTAAGPRIIEVNGRVGGFIPELAGHAAEIDLVDVGARLACGADVRLPAVVPDRVCLQFTTPAPVEAGIVTSVCRRADVDDIPGVVGYTELVRRGDPVGGYGTQDLNLVSAEAVDHDALEPIIDMIMDRVVYEFDLNGRRVTRSARDLVA
ncbi:MAG TPA: ATP-grasp domain-containing protein [Jatrophihabitans sp.]|nr:ATP-grasp domain-containing protein [Jatrophihabitans sp.]